MAGSSGSTSGGAHSVRVTLKPVGLVYLGHDDSTGGLAAVKLIPPAAALYGAALGALLLGSALLNVWSQRRFRVQ